MQSGVRGWTLSSGQWEATPCRTQGDPDGEWAKCVWGLDSPCSVHDKCPLPSSRGSLSPAPQTSNSADSPSPASQPKPRKEPVPRSRPHGKRERQMAGSCVASSPCAPPARRAHAEPRMLLSPRSCGSKAGGQAGPGSPLPRVLTVPWALALFSGHAEKSWASALLRSASLLLSSPLSPRRGLAAFASEEQRTHCDLSQAPLVGLPSPLGWQKRCLG